MVIFHPDLSEEDLQAQVAQVEGNITDQQGTITLINRESPWGRRRLAYPIRHSSRDVRDGIYVLYYFSAETGAMTEIEREIKLNDRILRYLLTQQIAPVMEPVQPEEEGAEGTPESAEGTLADAGDDAAPVEEVATEAATEAVAVEDAPAAESEVAAEAGAAAEAEAVVEDAPVDDAETQSKDAE
jgi:small subunit ribosomal protein S6